MNSPFHGGQMNSESGLNSDVRDVDDILEGLNACRSLVKGAQPSTEHSKVAVRLQTTGFDVVGQCNLAGERFSDVLNQTISEYLDCSNVTLSRNGKVIEKLNELKLRKPEILIAGIVGDTHEAAEKRIGNRRPLKLYQVVLAVDRWIIRGCLHMTGHKSVKEFLVADRDFFPVARATVRDAESLEDVQKMNVAIVNRARVALMEISELNDDQGEAELSTIQRLLKSDVG